MHRAPTMATAILSSLYGTLLSHSGAPYKLCPRFPMRKSPVLAWPCCRSRCSPTEAALPCRQLILLPGLLCLHFSRLQGISQALGWNYRIGSLVPELPLLLCSCPKGGRSKVICCQTRHFLTIHPHQGKETSPEDHHREENCTGYSHSFILEPTADGRGVLSLCSSCWGRWGWTLWGAGLPWDRDTSRLRWLWCEELLWVRGCVPIPGAADPADGGSWAKLASANPQHVALQARAWNYSWQREQPGIVPWGEGNSTLPRISASP